MKNTDIVTINVENRAAGITLPFDKLYLVRKTDREYIPKLFGYALVMGPNADLLAALSDLTPKYSSILGQVRNDETCNMRVIADDGAQLDKRKHSRQYIRTWWQLNVFEHYDVSNRVIVVPMLLSRKHDKLFPKYLSNHRWFVKGSTRRARRRATIVEGNTAAIPETAYLATPHAAPNDKVTSICSLCPRMLLHMQGACVPGQLICYKSLDLATILK
jgi:hypothetical protein